MFVSQSVDKISSELKVDENARQDASNEIPATNSADPTPTETALHAFHEAQIRKAESDADGHAKDLENRRLTIDIDGTKSELKRSPSEAQLRINAVDSRHADERTRLMDQRSNQRSNYQLFKNANGLNGTADYPESQLWHWAIVAAVIVGETILNAYFFQKGNELGWFGGFWQALIFSLINVALAIGCARGFCHHQHVRLRNAIAGWAALGAFVLLVLGWNLLLGHFRWALNEILQDPSREAGEALALAVQRFSDAPFRLFDFEAVTLVLFGVIIAVGTFIKTYTVQSPYPGFASEQRKLDAIESDCRDAKRDMQDEVEEAIEEIKTDLIATRGGLNDKLTEYQQLLRQAEKIPDNLAKFYSEQQSNYATLSRQYRQTNSQIRQSPPPARFDDQPSLSIEKPEFRLEIESEQKALQAARKEFGELTQLTNTSLEEINELGKESLRKLDAAWES